jgi:ATP-dependent 26S proteasome regulatory subunit
MRTKLANYFNASFPAVAIQTTDEARAMEDVFAAAKECGRSVMTWSAIEGFVDVSAGGKPVDDTRDLMGACIDGIESKRAKTVYILRDPHTWPFESDCKLLRAFREFLASVPEIGSSVVILANSYKPHATFEKLVTIIDHELPSPEDLKKIAEGICERNEMQLEIGADVLRALGGLTAPEAENALSLAVIETDKFDASVIYREKVAAVRRSGLLDIVEADERGLEAIGGLEEFKKWIGRRRRVWSPDAKKFGLAQPKGVLLVGVPGTGKSLAGKAVGTALGVPTLRLDFGAMFNSLVGESERRVREALALAGSMSPCVLWLDEIDKGLAGSNGGGENDSGVTKRLLGTVLNWMQERRRSVFIVATANNVSALPPELLRKGRFDEMFALDLPNTQEREAIFAIHILKRRPNGANCYDYAALAEATKDFTGSEIEAVVDDGMFRAFDVGSADVSTADMVAAAAETMPLAKTAKDQIEAIRKWGETRARPASARPSTGPGNSARKLR